MSARRKTACNLAEAGIPTNELAIPSDKALVVEICIISELVKSAPIGVAMIMVYNPVSGLIPASSAEAMLSGMLATPTVKAAIKSGRMFLRLMLQRFRAPSTMVAVIQDILRAQHWPVFSARASAPVCAQLVSVETAAGMALRSRTRLAPNSRPNKIPAMAAARGVVIRRYSMSVPEIFIIPLVITIQSATSTSQPAAITICPKLSQYRPASRSARRTAPAGRTGGYR